MTNNNNNNGPKLTVEKRCHADAWGEGVNTMPVHNNSGYMGNSVRWSIIEDDGSEDPMVLAVFKTKRPAQEIVDWANQHWNGRGDVEDVYGRTMVQERIARQEVS